MFCVRSFNRKKMNFTGDSGLVQMVVFDAKLTESYRGDWAPKTRLE